MSLSSSSLPLSSNPSLLSRSHLPSPEPNLSPFPISKLTKLSKPSLICFSLSPSNGSYYDGEEARWLREEQRWLREEQRWLRHESRWLAERESLIREISALRLRIQELELRQSEIQGVSASEAVAKVAALLQAVKEGESGKAVSRIAESGSGAVPLVVEEIAGAESGRAEEEVAVKEVAGEEKEVMKKRTMLRKGSEGEDVRALQVCLLATLTSLLLSS